MTSGKWMLYGANGYTGALLAEQAIKRGQRPLLAGRRADKLAPLAARLGLPFVAFDLADVGAVERALSGLDLVLHAAGPFVDTSEPMVRACLASRTSYLDITGEVTVFEQIFRRHEEARSRGVALLPGVGFDVVPSDCLARYVVDKLPGANQLEIAISMDGGRPSPGTSKSMADGVLAGCLRRSDGKLVGVPFGKGCRRVRFADAERSVLPIPWGDLSSAYRTTGVPNITTYMSIPDRMAKQAQVLWPLSALAQPAFKLLTTTPLRSALQRAIGARVQGPTEAVRRSARSQVWACARRADGQAVEAWLHTLEGYTYTVESALRAVERVLAERPVGSLTPARAFGADFTLEIPSTQRFDALPATAERSS